MNTFGNRIRYTAFGTSHGSDVGFVLEGLPAGFEVDMDAISFDISRRSAALNICATPRHEDDGFTVLSGLFGGHTDGSPLVVAFPNREHDRAEYHPTARPSHADYAAFIKYGGSADISGGGQFSGRLTLPMTFAGSVCRQLLKKRGVEVFSHVLAIGDVFDEPFNNIMKEKPPLDPFFPLVGVNRRADMEEALRRARERGDTLSCEIECAALGLPVGVGEPLADGVESTLSRLLFMIPALRGVEFGERHVFGSEMNDGFTDGGRTVTNRSGGVNGGMTNGMPLVFRAWFRAVPSIALPQTGYDLAEKKPVPLTINGRHDTAVLPRGAVAVEAAVCLGLAELMSGEQYA